MNAVTSRVLARLELADRTVYVPRISDLSRRLHLGKHLVSNTPYI